MLSLVVVVIFGLAFLQSWTAFRHFPPQPLTISSRYSPRIHHHPFIFFPPLLKTTQQQKPQQQTSLFLSLALSPFTPTPGNDLLQSLLPSKAERPNYEEEEQKKEAARDLLEIMTTPHLPSNPKYNKAKATEKFEFMQGIEEGLLRVQLEKQGLLGVGTMEEMIIRFLYFIIDPSIEYYSGDPLNEGGEGLQDGEPDQVQLLTKEDLQDGMARERSFAERKAAVLNFMKYGYQVCAPDVKELFPLTRENSPVIYDNVQRRQTTFSPVRVFRSIRLAEDYGDHQIVIPAYVTSHDAVFTTSLQAENRARQRQLLQTDAIYKVLKEEGKIDEKDYQDENQEELDKQNQKPRVFIILPNEKGWKSKTLRVFADEWSKRTNSIVVIPDIYRGRTDLMNNTYEKALLHGLSIATRRQIYDDIIATLKFVHEILKPRTVGILGFGVGGGIGLDFVCDLHAIACLGKFQDLKKLLRENAASFSFLRNATLGRTSLNSFSGTTEELEILLNQPEKWNFQEIVSKPFMKSFFEDSMKLRKLPVSIQREKREAWLITNKVPYPGMRKNEKPSIEDELLNQLVKYGGMSPDLVKQVKQDNLAHYSKLGATGDASTDELMKEDLNELARTDDLEREETEEERRIDDEKFNNRLVKHLEKQGIELKDTQELKQQNNEETKITKPTEELPIIEEEVDEEDENPVDESQLEPEELYIRNMLKKDPFQGIQKESTSFLNEFRFITKWAKYAVDNRLMQANSLISPSTLVKYQPNSITAFEPKHLNFTKVKNCLFTPVYITDAFDENDFDAKRYEEYRKLKNRLRRREHEIHDFAFNFADGVTKNFFLLPKTVDDAKLREIFLDNAMALINAVNTHNLRDIDATGLKDTKFGFGLFNPEVLEPPIAIYTTEDRHHDSTDCKQDFEDVIEFNTPEYFRDIIPGIYPPKGSGY